MDCCKTDVVSLMQSGVRFHIPFYQRPYEWGESQCQVLLDDLDLVRAQLPNPAPHFLGTLVVQPQENTKTLVIIDGQQRLTTMYLLFQAISRLAHERAQDANSSVRYQELAQELNSILVDASDSHRPPFTLTGSDKLVLSDIFTGKNEPKSKKDSPLLTKNYLFLHKQLSQRNADELWGIYEASRYLELVELRLEPCDQPQDIFESLNSKGLELKPWDNVRNLVLMNLPQEDTYYYDTYWKPIEEKVLPWTRDAFVRFYLEAKQGSVPKKGLYYEFKKFRASCGMNAVQLLQDMQRHAEVFSWIDWRQFPLEKDQNLKAQIEYRLLRLQRMYSGPSQRCWTQFGLQCMLRYQNEELTAAQIIEVLRLVETLIFRRWFCNRKPNALESFFASLDHKIVTLNEPKAGSDYVSKLKWLLCAPDAQLPLDDQLEKTFLNRNFNYIKGPQKVMRNFMLACFEEEHAHGAKSEQVNIFERLSAFSLEHIMPQSLTDQWKAALGPDAEKIHGYWLHRIANLTLIDPSFNSKYSNRPFKEKCKMEHGYAHSALYSSRAIAQHENWGEAELQQRNDELYQMALKIWPYPTLDNKAES